MHKLREVHHLQARLTAMGLKATEVAVRTNRTAAGVRAFINTPAGKNLVAEYAKEEHEKVLAEADWNITLKRRIMTLADEEALARLEEDPSQFSTRDIVALSNSASDRVGYGPQSTTFNLNADVGSRLDLARSKRSKILEGRVEGNVVKLIRSRI